MNTISPPDAHRAELISSLLSGRPLELSPAENMLAVLEEAVRATNDAIRDRGIDSKIELCALTENVDGTTIATMNVIVGGKTIRSIYFSWTR